MSLTNKLLSLVFKTSEFTTSQKNTTEDKIIDIKLDRPDKDAEIGLGLEEDYDSFVSKLKKQGKSTKAAKAIAGAVASYKAKGGGKGPTAKQKKRAK